MATKSLSGIRRKSAGNGGSNRSNGSSSRSFSDQVKQHGSVSAALKANGYSQGSNGRWSKGSGSSSGGVIGTAASTSRPGSSGGGSISSSRNYGYSSSSSHRGSSGGVIGTAASTSRPSYRGGSGGGYDPNRDYSKAIMDAQKQGASSGYINQLRQERQNKINAQYGGRDPYRGSANIMGSGWSQRDRDRETISQPGGQLYYADGRKAVHNMGRPWEAGVDYSALAEQYAQKGNWDAVDDLLMRRAAKMQETGSRGGGRSNLSIWHDLNQRYQGPDAGMSFGEMQAGAEQVYGPGGKWGQGGSDRVYPGSYPVEYPEFAVENGYGDFDAYLDAMGYDRMEAATRDAIRASVDQAVGGLNAQIGAANRQSDEAARQAYIAKMIGQKNLDQQLSAEGYAGGMADSQRIATETAYQNEVNDLEMQRQQTIGELQRAIENAQLTGDMEAAQKMAEYLQVMQGQYANWVQNQQAADREDAWRRQEMDREDAWRQQDIEREDAWRQQQVQEENRAMAYDRAMTLIKVGVMPNQELLTAAGIDRGTAGRLYQTVQAEMMARTAGRSSGRSSGGGSRRSSGRSSRRSGGGGRSSGGGYNNGGLTADQVMQIQKALGVKPDGMWGHDSYAASGGLSADQAWAKHEAAVAANDSGGERGWVMVPGYGRVTWPELKSLVDSGEVKETVGPDGRHTYRRVR